MGCGGRGKGSASKGINKGKGKGQQTGGKGGGNGGGMQNPYKGSMNSGQLQKQLASLEEQFKQVLVGSRPKAGLWICKACGDDRCFAKKQECHTCGAPRANLPIKASMPERQAGTIKAEPKADAMEEDAAGEVPIEEDEPGRMQPGRPWLVDLRPMRRRANRP